MILIDIALKLTYFCSVIYDSTWSPPGLHGFQVDSMDSMDSRWIPWTPGGLHAMITERCNICWTPPGLHLDSMKSMWNMWTPPGIYGGV
jgi:hypothetical protein